MLANYDVLLWQSFFAIFMFLSLIISYLLPIIVYIFTSKNHSRLTTTVDDEALHQNNHWNYHLALQPDLLQKHRWKCWLSYCNCISAGVFLGVCFLNLVPCVEDEFGSLKNDFPSIKNIFGSYPLGQFTVICGLFLVLFLEEFLSKCFKTSSSSGHTHEVPVFYLDEESTELRNETHHDHDRLEQELLLNSDEQISNESQNDETSARTANIVRTTSQNHNDFHDHGHHHHVDIGSMAARNESMFSFFILMFATSIHSLFEGMALGLQSNLKTAIHLFIGILLHECLVAIALGLNAIRLQQENIKIKTHIKFAIVFALMIPLGNVLGLLLGYTPGHFGRFISAIFQGFAAGTFIHVTFFELIPEEFILSNVSNQKQSSSTFDNPRQQPKRQDNVSNTTTTEEELETNNHHTSQSNMDYVNHHQDNSIDVVVSKNLKLKKISLLLCGFLIIALLPFVISE